jgi:ABC-type antimicrobial peptide transport system permease subunit
MAGAGIYAVLAFAVSSRTREIGVRRALGARNEGIVRMVLRQGLAQLAIGLGLGLVLALGFAQILSNVLVGVSTFDPPTFLGVGVVLALVVVAASTIPTRRALAVDPMVALRYE